MDLGEGFAEHLVLAGYIAALLWISGSTGLVTLLVVDAWQPPFAVALLTYAVVLAILSPFAEAVVREVLEIVAPAVDYFDTTYLVSYGRLYDDIQRDMNLLIVRASGDEASAALSAMRFANWVAAKAASTLIPIALLPERVLMPISRRIHSGPVENAILIGLDVVTLIGALLWAFLTPYCLSLLPGFDLYVVPSPRVSGVAKSLSVWSIMLVSAPVLLAGLFTVLLAVITSLCRMPFGFYGGLEPLGPQLSAEASPPGRWVVHQLREQSYGSDRLAHGESYSQPEAIELLVKWLNSPTTRRKPG